MERRSFLQLLAAASAGVTMPALATMPEHKNQTLLRMMDDCVACNSNHLLLHQKFDDILLFINDNYHEPLYTTEEITQLRVVLNTPRKDLTTEVLGTYSSSVLETVFPVAVVKFAVVNTTLTPSHMQKWELFNDRYRHIIMVIGYGY